MYVLRGHDIYFPACPLLDGSAPLEIQRALPSAMHSQLCAAPAALLLTPSTKARVKMTRARAVGSGGGTACEWKEGGNAVRSALMNCVTVHETAKWDSPH